MSCETTPTAVATRAAPKSGISRTGSKNGFTAGSTPQVSFFAMMDHGPANEKTAHRPAVRKTKTGGAAARAPKAQTGPRTRRRGRRKAVKTGPAKNGKPVSQGSFFDVAAPKTAGDKQATEARDTVAPQPFPAVPSQRRAILGQAFSPDELRKLSVQLRFGLAAANRHVRTLGSGAARDIGHGDPRPADWARLDVKQFEFLTNQLAKARRGDGTLDLSSLKRGELVELWEFLRFEADRALRNIDHLQTPGGPIRGASADYLAQNHKLEARFYTYLANQIEALFPAENIQAEYPTGTGDLS